MTSDHFDKVMIIYQGKSLVRRRDGAKNLPILSAQAKSIQLINNIVENGLKSLPLELNCNFKLNKKESHANITGSFLLFATKTALIGKY